MKCKNSNLNKLQKELKVYRNPVKNSKESKYGKIAYVDPNAKIILAKKIQSYSKKIQETIGKMEQMSNQKRDNQINLRNSGKNMKGILKRQTNSRCSKKINNGNPKNRITECSKVEEYEYINPSFIPKKSKNYNTVNKEYNNVTQYESDVHQDFRNEKQISKGDFYSQKGSPKLANIFRKYSPKFGSVKPSNIITIQNSYEKFNISSERNNTPNAINNNDNRIYIPSKPTQTYSKPNKNSEKFIKRCILGEEIGHKYQTNNNNNNIQYNYYKKPNNSFCKNNDSYKNNNGLTLEISKIGKEDIYRLSEIPINKKHDISPESKKEYSLDSKIYNRKYSYSTKRPFDRFSLVRNHEIPAPRRLFTRNSSKNIFKLSNKGPYSVEKIIKIQSVFRGYYLNKRLSLFLLISIFAENIEKILSRYLRLYAWNKLVEEYQDEKNEILEKTRKFKAWFSSDLNSPITTMKKYLFTTPKMNKNNNIINLVLIRALKEKRMNEIRNAFNKWIFVKKVLETRDKLVENDSLNREKILEKEKELEIINSKKIELEEELEFFRHYYNFSPLEKLISIDFISTDQEIKHTIIAKNTDLFSKIEAELYQKYEKYKYTENVFLVNGSKINKNLTLADNRIKNKDIITLYKFGETI